MAEKKEEKSNPLLEKMISIGKDLKNPQFKVKNTTFNIVKLPPMDGFRVAEQIRINLIQTADSFDAGDGSESQNVALFVKAIMGLPPAFIDYLMEKLFKHIQYQGKDVGIDKGWVELSGMEDMAFQNFEVINIYEVLGRALYVNFSGSFFEITSAFPDVGQLLKRLKQKT